MAARKKIVSRKKTPAPKARGGVSAGRKAGARRGASGAKGASGKRANGLHLPSLRIEGFRGIKELQLSDLGRVTLLVGENGSGKSSILEAVRIYASGGAPNVLEGILRTRENMLERQDENGDTFYVPDHGSLFFGYGEPKLGDVIKIGCPENGRSLELALSKFERKELKNMPSDFLSILEAEGLKGMEVFSGSKRKRVGKFPFVGSKEKGAVGYSPLRLGSRLWNEEGVEFPSLLHWELGPNLPHNDLMVAWYGKVALTAVEEEVLRALRFMRPDVERLASVPGGNFEFGGMGIVPRIMHMMANSMHMMVKLKNVDVPVPLKSLGDGVVRMLGLALALTCVKNSFLFLDEVENGMHYSRFLGLWEFVLRTAEENNVQVIAATHSWDCVKGFAEAVRKSNAVKGSLFRIDREEDRVWPVFYPGADLTIATDAGIEVR